MKIHDHLINSVAESLEHCFGEGYYADKVLERQFKQHKKWGARDRRFVAETFYDCVRNWRGLWYLLDAKKFENKDFDREDLVNLVLIYVWNKGIVSDLPKRLSYLNVSELEKRKKHLQEERVLRESVTDWFDNYGFSQWRNDWDSLLSSLNHQAQIYLRTNELKISREELLKQLRKEGFEVEAVEEVPTGIKLLKRKNLFISEAFKRGLFEVQDISSQKVSYLLNPQPGEKVVDACAGAGGKSLHLAALMQNKGKILSLDVHERKLEELKKRRKRAGVDILEIRPISSSKVIKRLKGQADRLLLDVPCSGSGVLRRNPDTKWKLNQEEVDRLIQLQSDILEDYSSMLKPGGEMVYATCSIFPSENSGQVKKFLESTSAFELIEEVFMDPRDSFDGFYGARLKKLT